MFKAKSPNSSRGKLKLKSNSPTSSGPKEFKLLDCLVGVDTSSCYQDIIVHVVLGR